MQSYRYILNGFTGVPGQNKCLKKFEIVETCVGTSDQPGRRRQLDDVRHYGSIMKGSLSTSGDHCQGVRPPKKQKDLKKFEMLETCMGN